MVFSIFNEKKKSNCGCPQGNEADANGHFVMFFFKDLLFNDEFTYSWMEKVGYCTVFFFS